MVRDKALVTQSMMRGKDLQPWATAPLARALAKTVCDTNADALLLFAVANLLVLLIGVNLRKLC